MVYALGWMFVAALFAVWSLVLWAAHALGHWSVTQAGALGGAGMGLEGLRWPDWLAPWVPPELTALMGRWIEGLGPFVDTLLQAAPSLAPLLSVLSWGLWAVGGLMLLGLGVGLHLLVARWLRRDRTGGALPMRSQPSA